MNGTTSESYSPNISNWCNEHSIQTGLAIFEHIVEHVDSFNMSNQWDLDFALAKLADGPGEYCEGRSREEVAEVSYMVCIKLLRED